MFKVVVNGQEYTSNKHTPAKISEDIYDQMMGLDNGLPVDLSVIVRDAYYHYMLWLKVYQLSVEFNRNTSELIMKPLNT